MPHYPTTCAIALGFYSREDVPYQISYDDNIEDETNDKQFVEEDKSKEESLRE